MLDPNSEHFEGKHVESKWMDEGELEGGNRHEQEDFEDSEEEQETIRSKFLVPSRVEQTKGELYNQAMSKNAAVQEFTMKLPNQPDFTYASAPNRYHAVGGGPSGGGDLHKRCILLEEALREEILKSEETQSENEALKELLEIYQINGGADTISNGGFGLQNSTQNSVRIRDVVQSDRKQRGSSMGNSPNIKIEVESEQREIPPQPQQLAVSPINNEEREMMIEEIEELRQTILEYEEELKSMRDINETAKAELGVAIEGLQQARELDQENQILVGEVQNLREHIQHQQQQGPTPEIDVDEIKNRFKSEMDQLRDHYDSNIQEITLQNNNLKEQLEAAIGQDSEYKQFEMKIQQLQEQVNISEQENIILKTERQNYEEIAQESDKLDSDSIQMDDLRQQIEEKNRQIDELSCNLDSATSRFNNSEQFAASSNWRREREMEIIEEKSERQTMDLRQLHSKMGALLQNVNGRVSDSSSKSSLYLILQSFFCSYLHSQG